MRKQTKCGAVCGARKENQKLSDKYQYFNIFNGGESGIRTHETVPRLHTFQACAFDHSATAPLTSL